MKTTFVSNNFYQFLVTLVMELKEDSTNYIHKSVMTFISFLVEEGKENTIFRGYRKLEMPIHIYHKIPDISPPGL